ncbi:guanylate kinase [Salmonella phage SE13]|uniref:Guanylate kinase n=1 Tax=Salmonella phage SE13 TaxID=2575325 RepID=A0A513ZWQ6_9CAUD|nr:thymidylate kinase [Salmonella phage SE13]QDH45124.1 guanylate kinase [Salmonella phage SE13]
MNIIIEGPDNAGKSTLIEFLKSRTGRSVIHNTVDKNPESVMAKQTKENALEGNCIYDRSAVISEYIYCLVLQRTPVVNINISHVADMCDNAIVIFCMPPVEKVLATTKDEMPGVVENLEALYNQYDNLIDELVLMSKQFFIYDWTIEEDGPGAALEYINERINKEWNK